MAPKKTTARPMRIQARKGSYAEKQHFLKSQLPSGPWPMPKAIAPGIDPSPLDDLIFHGGKTVPQMGYQNVFLGQSSDWTDGDRDNIDAAIKRAMQEQKLNNVMVQYFPGASVTCDVRAPFVMEEPRASKMGEPDVQDTVVRLFDEGRIKKSDLDTTIFNLCLAPGTVLSLDDVSSLQGLGGYHGSIKFKRAGKSITLYYSANVFSERTPAKENGIVVFKPSWKNVVGTLYHEINEFRTDADVNDAIKTGDDDFLGWMSRQGHEVGDQPIFVANPLSKVFKEVLAKAEKTAVQFMYSNGAHGAEGPIDSPH
jgi:hypothetical protein